jgi:hypothetical protein
VNREPILLVKSEPGLPKLGFTLLLALSLEEMNDRLHLPGAEKLFLLSSQELRLVWGIHHQDDQKRAKRAAMNHYANLRSPLIDAPDIAPIIWG